MALVMTGSEGSGSLCDDDDDGVMRWEKGDGIPGLIFWRWGIVSLYGMFLLEYYGALI